MPHTRRSRYPSGTASKVRKPSFLGGPGVQRGPSRQRGCEERISRRFASAQSGLVKVVSSGSTTHRIRTECDANHVLPSPVDHFRRLEVTLTCAKLGYTNTEVFGEKRCTCSHQAAWALAASVAKRWPICTVPAEIQLVYVDILELQHEAQPVVRIPTERDSADVLPAAINPASDVLRDAGRDVAVRSTVL